MQLILIKEAITSITKKKKKADTKKKKAKAKADKKEEEEEKGTESLGSSKSE